jgi:phospholipid transport system substrate-binding protein
MQVDPNPSGEPASGEAKVRARYVKPGNPAVPVEYAMWKTPEGWKVYDIVVDGVSLVTTYRSTFDEEIRAGGLDGLIARLQDKNQEATRAGR